MYHHTVQSFRDAFTHLFHPKHSNNHRPRVLHPHAFYVYVILLGVFYIGLTSINHFSARRLNILGYASSITIDQIMSEVNQQRTLNGLSPLKTNDRLNQAAQAKARFMFEKQFWAHTAPDHTPPWAFFDQVGYRYSVAGENLARDFSNTHTMMSAWMASPTHRENILNAKYDDIGVAVVDGKLQGVETTLVVQLFGRPVVGDANLAEDGRTTGRASVENDTQDVNSTFLGSGANQGNSASMGNENSLAGVLGSENLPITNLTAAPLFSPLHIMKAVSLALLLVLLTVLVYDAFLLGHDTQLRKVGKNFAHICFLMMIVFLVMFFRAGLIDQSAYIRDTTTQSTRK